MKFSTKEDMEIPIETAFEMVSDFDAFERIALQRGIDISQVGDHSTARVGMTWKVRADLRGKRRIFDVELVKYDTPTELEFEAGSSLTDSKFLVELVALSRNRTRMRVELDVKPKTLSARLMIQSARLARNSLNKRYKFRISHFVKDMEERHKSSLKTTT